MQIRIGLNSGDVVVLGEGLAKEYLAVKRSEVRPFKDQDTAFEIAQHFYNY